MLTHHKYVFLFSLKMRTVSVFIRHSSPLLFNISFLASISLFLSLSLSLSHTHFLTCSQSHKHTHTMFPCCKSRSPTPYPKAVCNMDPFPAGYLCLPVPHSFLSGPVRPLALGNRGLLLFLQVTLSLEVSQRSHTWYKMQIIMPQ